MSFETMGAFGPVRILVRPRLPYRRVTSPVMRRRRMLLRALRRRKQDWRVK